MSSKTAKKRGLSESNPAPQRGNKRPKPTESAYDQEYNDDHDDSVSIAHDDPAEQAAEAYHDRETDDQSETNGNDVAADLEASVEEEEEEEDEVPPNKALEMLFASADEDQTLDLAELASTYQGGSSFDEEQYRLAVEASFKIAPSRKSVLQQMSERSNSFPPAMRSRIFESSWAVWCPVDRSDAAHEQFLRMHVYKSEPSTDDKVERVISISKRPTDGSTETRPLIFSGEPCLVNGIYLHDIGKREKKNASDFSKFTWQISHDVGIETAESISNAHPRRLPIQFHEASKNHVYHALRCMWDDPHIYKSKKHDLKIAAWRDCQTVYEQYGWKRTVSGKQAVYTDANGTLVTEEHPTVIEKARDAFIAGAFTHFRGHKVNGKYPPWFAPEVVRAKYKKRSLMLEETDRVATLNKGYRANFTMSEAEIESSEDATNLYKQAKLAGFKLAKPVYYEGMTGKRLSRDFLGDNDILPKRVITPGSVCIIDWGYRLYANTDGKYGEKAFFTSITIVEMNENVVTNDHLPVHGSKPVRELACDMIERKKAAEEEEARSSKKAEGAAANDGHRYDDHLSYVDASTDF